MENMMTPADIAAVTRDDNRDGFFGEGGFFWIVVLFLIFGMMGGGGFGWGNNAATQGAITRGELYEGFNTNAILQNQNGLSAEQVQLHAGHGLRYPHAHEVFHHRPHHAHRRQLPAVREPAVRAQQ